MLNRAIVLLSVALVASPAVSEGLGDSIRSVGEKIGDGVQ